MTDKLDRIVESFGPRTVTPAEFSNLLNEIVGLASLAFCQAKHAQGLSRDEINEALQGYLEVLKQWQATCMGEFMAFANGNAMIESEIRLPPSLRSKLHDA